MIAYRGGPGYSTVVEFMRAGINRQRKRAAIIIKCGPRSYEFINGRVEGGEHMPRVRPPLDPPLYLPCVSYKSRPLGNLVMSHFCAMHV